MEIQRESVMLSAVRAFCKALFGAAGFLIGLIVVGIIALVFLGGGSPTDKTDLLIAPDAEGNRELLSHATPVILRINIHGVIGMDKLTGKTVELQLQDSQGPMLKKGRVKAVLLHINSPGGTVNDSDQIYRALEVYQKRFDVPVYAYIDGMCASDALYIASSAEKSFATPVSVIGSVGVKLGPNFNIYGLMEKYGVKQLTLTEGKDKDMLSPFRPWQPGEDTSLKDIIAYEYDRFVDIVIKGHPRMDRTKLVNDYGAHVFDAPKAMALGYVDEGNSSYSETLTALCQKAGIKEDQKYQVVELVPQKFFLTDLMEGKALGLDKLKWMLDSNLSNKLLYLYDHG
ncbi:MAG: S49 family peptidase [Chlamydiales bacterium]|nr:S49 family peptidase [Chlamydiales bacterium]